VPSLRAFLELEDFNGRGFGLVELLIVLGLMGIMAGGAAPEIHHMKQEWALWGGTRLLESSLLWARTHAIAANDSLTLIVDQNGRRFFWQAPDGIRFENTLRWLPSGISIIQSPRKPLRFFPHGNAVPAGTFIIQGEAGTYRVVVSALGRVRIQRDR
jgi:prepilin-type N-terminal cleavage/methylation domain-containing protein